VSVQLASLPAHGEGNVACRAEGGRRITTDALWTSTARDWTRYRGAPRNDEGERVLPSP